MQAGALELAHRVALAPMTRTRADPQTLAPTAMMAEYYAQRASPGGLLVSEATAISPEAAVVWNIYAAVREKGGRAPGIWTKTQSEGWAKVARAAHKKGARISCQLLHAGRVAQPDIAEHPIVRGKDYPLPPVSSSPVPMREGPQKGDYNWDREAATPRELRTEEIARVCGDYQHAAENAMRAGFDCVELHAAHGYLMDQFLCDGVNKRSDRYGGTIANRCRFLFEAAAALLDVVGAGRLGVRLSPLAIDENTGAQNQMYFGAECTDPEEIYAAAVKGLNDFPLAYLLLTEPRAGGLSAKAGAAEGVLQNTKYRRIYKGTLIGAGGFTPKSAARAIAKGDYDIIAFGRWFLSNPDLPERLRLGRDLNVYHRPAFYGGGEEGYTDYPSWDEIQNPPQYELMPQSQIGASLKQAKKK